MVVGHAECGLIATATDMRLTCEAVANTRRQVSTRRTGNWEPVICMQRKNIYGHNKSLKITSKHKLRKLS